MFHQNSSTNTRQIFLSFDELSVYSSNWLWQENPGLTQWLWTMFEQKTELQTSHVWSCSIICPQEWQTLDSVGRVVHTPLLFTVVQVKKVGLLRLLSGNIRLEQGLGNSGLKREIFNHKKSNIQQKTNNLTCLIRTRFRAGWLNIYVFSGLGRLISPELSSLPSLDLTFSGFRFICTFSLSSGGSWTSIARSPTYSVSVCCSLTD